MSYHTPHEQPVRTSTICVELLFSFDLNITTDVVIPYDIDLYRYNWCRKWNVWNADCSPIELAMSFIQKFFDFHLQVIGPKTVVLFRNRQYGFGFTLRHFIVFPPESPAVSVAILFSSPFPMIFGQFLNCPPLTLSSAKNRSKTLPASSISRNLWTPYLWKRCASMDQHTWADWSRAIVYSTLMAWK